MTQISLLSVTSGAIPFDLTTESQQGHNSKDTIQSLQKECLHQRIYGFSGNLLLKQKNKAILYVPLLVIVPINESAKILAKKKLIKTKRFNYFLYQY